VSKGYGFIHVDNEHKDTFFHEKALHPSLAFDEQLIGRRVTFKQLPDIKGPTAAHIKPIQ
jgi:cold shock CspA family protein